MPAFTKGKWLIHKGYFHEITLNPKQYYIYPDSGDPYTDDFIGCAEEADARLVVEAPVMYDLLNKAFHILGKNATNDTICREIDECLSRVDGAPVQTEKGEYR